MPQQSTPSHTTQAKRLDSFGETPFKISPRDTRAFIEMNGHVDPRRP